MVVLWSLCSLWGLGVVLIGFEDERSSLVSDMLLATVFWQPLASMLSMFTGKNVKDGQCHFVGATVVTVVVL